MKNKKQIYLDYSASTPIDKKVLDKMFFYSKFLFGNPSSIYSLGREADFILEKSREDIAKILGSEKDEIIFTGSGTESDNMAILGIARANRDFGNHVLISSIEHKAIISPAEQLKKEGFIVEYIPVKPSGLVDVEDVLSRITDKTILISIMYANNEIGTIQPIREIGEKIKEFKKSKVYPVFHTDACQAVNYLNINVKEINVDSMTINASKIYGPKGVGLLYLNKNVKINPIVFGGGQERGLRSGTENVVAIVGFVEALLLSEKLKIKEYERLNKLRNYFIKNLKENIPDIVFNGHPDFHLPNNIHISIPYIEGESIILMLDEKGVQASTGSACSSSDLQVSHVLQAIKQDVNLMHGSIRFSLGRETKEGDCDYVVKVLVDIVKRLKVMSPLIK